MQNVTIDAPQVVAEVRAAFERYEQALITNDVGVLDELFWNDPRAVRFASGDARYGHAAIAAFRAARDASDVARTLERVTITTFGLDYAVTMAEYRRTTSNRRGQQSQTWVRLSTGWRIVAAHVSLEPAAAPNAKDGS